MKRIGFALAAGFGVLLCAVSPASADTPSTAPTPKAVVVTGNPVVVPGPAASAEVISTVPARRGLFGRLRNRGTATPVAFPAATPLPAATGTVITTPAPVVPAPLPSTVPVPTQMPVRPAPGGVSVVPTPGVVPASGTVMSPPGWTAVATGGTPVMTAASYTVVTSSAVVTPVRRGLFGRLRAAR
ncbi:MAG: hypothetical protein JWO38_2800 [Gemmataceae bacterium]|nr:hypothetical protein [Gemmataceae bacterium]